MKAIDIAKQKFNALSKDDIRIQSCPDILGILPTPDCCDIVRYSEICEDCIKCWDREVDSVKEIINEYDDMLKELED
jgi:hypothetical protein